MDKEQPQAFSRATGKSAAEQLQKSSAEISTGADLKAAIAAFKDNGKNLSKGFSRKALKELQGLAEQLEKAGISDNDGVVTQNVNPAQEGGKGTRVC